MKKLIALLSLVVLTAPAFAWIGSAEEVIQRYGKETRANAASYLQDVLEDVESIQRVIKQGYGIAPGTEERNQYGTQVRENLERHYQALFDEDSALASYVFEQVIHPISDDISGITLGNVVEASGAQATALDMEALANVFNTMKLVKIYVNVYHEDLCGDPEKHQGATAARENLEKAYAQLFKQNPELASYVFKKYIQEFPCVFGIVL